jgi:predicted double-glycine peptidase
MRQQKFKILKQTTNQSCLAACLLSILKYKYGIPIDPEEERRILWNGLTRFIIDFSLGHLYYVCEKFNKEIELHVDSPYYFEYLKSLEFPEKLSIVNSKIDIKLINRLVSNLPIVYLDGFYLANSLIEKTHFPHFVIISRMSEKEVTLMDPFDGKEKIIDKKILMRAIRDLKNRLWIAPKLIIIK